MAKGRLIKGGKSLAIVILAAILLLSGLPLTVFAEGETTTEPVEKAAALALYEAAGIDVPGDFYDAGNGGAYKLKGKLPAVIVAEEGVSFEYVSGEFYDVESGEDAQRPIPKLQKVTGKSSGNSGVAPLGDPPSGAVEPATLKELISLNITLMSGQKTLVTGSGQKGTSTVYGNYSASVARLLPGLEITIEATKGNLVLVDAGNADLSYTFEKINDQKIVLKNFVVKGNIGDGVVTSFGSFSYYFPNTTTPNNAEDVIKVTSVKWGDTELPEGGKELGDASYYPNGKDNYYFGVTGTAGTNWGFRGFSSSQGTHNVQLSLNDSRIGQKDLTLNNGGVNITFGAAEKVANKNSGYYPAGSLQTTLKLSYTNIDVPGWSSLPSNWTVYDATASAFETFHEYNPISGLTDGFQLELKKETDGTVLLRVTNTKDLRGDPVGTGIVTTFSANMRVQKVRYSENISAAGSTGSVKIEYIKGEGTAPDSFFVTKDGAGTVTNPLVVLASGSYFNYTLNVNAVKPADLGTQLASALRGIAKSSVNWKFDATGYADEQTQIGQSGMLSRPYISNGIATLENGNMIVYDRIWFLVSTANKTLPEGVGSLTITDNTAKNSYDADDLQMIGFALPTPGGDTTYKLSVKVGGVAYTFTSATDVPEDKFYTYAGGSGVGTIVIPKAKNAVVTDYSLTFFKGTEAIKTGSANTYMLFRTGDGLRTNTAPATKAIDNIAFVTAKDTSNSLIDLTWNGVTTNEISLKGTVGFKKEIPDDVTVGKTYKNLTRSVTGADGKPLNAPGDELEYTVTVQLPADTAYLHDLAVVDHFRENLQFPSQLTADITIVSKNENFKLTNQHGGTVTTSSSGSTYTTKITGAKAVKSGYNIPSGASGWYAYEFSGDFYQGDKITIVYKATVKETGLGTPDGNGFYKVVNDIYVGHRTPGSGGNPGDPGNPGGPGGNPGGPGGPGGPGNPGNNWKFGGEADGTCEIRLAPPLLYGDTDIYHTNSAANTVPVTQYLAGDKVVVKASGGTNKSDKALKNATLQVWIASNLQLDPSASNWVTDITRGGTALTSGYTLKYYDATGAEISSVTAANCGEVRIITLTLDSASDVLQKTQNIAMNIHTVAKAPTNAASGYESQYSYAYFYTFDGHLHINKELGTGTLRMSSLSGSVQGQMKKAMGTVALLSNKNIGWDIVDGMGRIFVYDTQSVTVTAKATNLTLSKSASPSSAYTGGELAYSITLKNNKQYYLPTDRHAPYTLRYIADILPVDEVIKADTVQVRFPNGTTANLDSGLFTVSTSNVTLDDGNKAQRVLITFEPAVSVEVNKNVVVSYKTTLADNKLLMNPTRVSSASDANMATVFVDQNEVWNATQLSKDSDNDTRGQFFWNIPGVDTTALNRIPASTVVTHKDKRIAPGVQVVLNKQSERGDPNEFMNTGNAVVEWKLTMMNGSAAQEAMHGFYVVNILPLGLEPNTADLMIGGDTPPTGTYKNNNGNWVLYWKFDAAKLAELGYSDGLKAGQKLELRFKSFAERGVVGTLTNNAYIIPFGGNSFFETQDIPGGWGSYVEKNNPTLDTFLKGDGNILPRDPAVWNSKSIKVLNGTGASAAKKVENAATGQVTASSTPHILVDVERGDEVRYSYTLSNEVSSTPLSSIEIYDVLPHKGDAYTLMSGARGSDWGPVLDIDDLDLSVILDGANVGYTIEYSAGSATGIENLRKLTWTDTWTSSDAPVSFRIRLDDSVELFAGQDLIVSWKMSIPDISKLPVGAVEKMAYNSACFYFEVKDNSSSVFDYWAEPEKVGLKLNGEAELDLEVRALVTDNTSTAPVTFDFILEKRDQHFTDLWNAVDMTTVDRSELGNITVTQREGDADTQGCFSIRVTPGAGALGGIFKDLDEGVYRIRELNSGKYTLSYSNSNGSGNSIVLNSQTADPFIQANNRYYYEAPPVNPPVNPPVTPPVNPPVNPPREGEEEEETIDPPRLPTTDPDDTTPDDPTENLGDPDTPVADTEAWSLFNLIMAIIALVDAVVLIVTVFARKGKQDDADYSDEAEREHAGRRLMTLKIVAALTGLIPGLLFLILENIRLPMVWLTRWTPLIAAMFILHMILLIFQIVIKKRDKNDNGDDAAIYKDAE